MADWQDQAAGLRRLVARPTPRSICFNGGRGQTGSTSIVANLALALALAGQRVLILDEHDSQANIAKRLAMPHIMDWGQALAKRLPMAALWNETTAGVGIMQMSAAQRHLALLSAEEEDRLAFEFNQLTSAIDIILIDALAIVGDRIPSLNLVAAENVVVVCNRAESLTDGYAMMKRLNKDYGQRAFRVLVNRVDSFAEASAVFERLQEVAQRFIDVQMKLIGYVPEDEKLARANRLCQPVVTAFADAEASMAFTQLADIIQRWPQPSDDRFAPAGLLHRLIQSSRAFAEHS
ncbi:flagellar biosynthesis protein FlhG [Chitinivorax tropicus]|uniref:Flagellar biosynthesis protein FlhG n=1 Tax=Chitinivorax tropicus TaxID=714531 RepID=A0A840MEY5_9PROT|nr:cellulose synthase operon protein YhjQ/BcsQ [Chitinivorax tropicus]MBB5017824.1 flagellar biosynthesis protein FlhG [Chitinivorax tropicus]